MKKLFLGIFLVLLFCTTSLAETSVWKIEKGNFILFLGGTCHILRPSDFPLPPEFDKAYRAAGLLVFEADPSEFSSPATQKKLMSRAMYTDGSTLEQRLSPQTYQSLKEYCTANGLPLELLKKFKPSILAVTMEAVELAKLNATREGVDLHYYARAKRDGKVVEGLETVDEQIAFLSEMGQGNEEEFVNLTLNEMKSVRQFYESLVDAWKRGDTVKLTELVISDLQKTPELYKRLLTDRNSNWLPRIDAYSQTPQIEFLLVGIGHLVGPDGIIEALRQKGYKVQKL